MYWKCKISTREHRQGRRCYIKQTCDLRPLMEDVLLRGDFTLSMGEIIMVNIVETKDEWVLPEDFPDRFSVLITKYLNGPQPFYAGLILLDGYKDVMWKAWNKHYA